MYEVVHERIENLGFTSSVLRLIPSHDICYASQRYSWNALGGRAQLNQSFGLLSVAESMLQG